MGTMLYSRGGGKLPEESSMGQKLQHAGTSSKGEKMISQQAAYDWLGAGHREHGQS